MGFILNQVIFTEEGYRLAGLEQMTACLALLNIKLNSLRKSLSLL
jgi:hypothetical protein